MVRTYYERLGVAETATTEEIEAAYRERLKETHPDVNDAGDAGQRTRRLVEARDVLVDDAERARYDRLGHDAYAGDTGAGDDDSGPVERAARERHARERVSESTGTASETGSTADSGTASTGRSGGGPSGTTGAWRESASYTVRRDVRAAGDYRQLVPSGRSLTLLALTFALYPVLLFCALVPAFPLLVNVTVALCALLVVAYLQTYPNVAVLVFGGWSAIASVLVMALAVDPVTLVGLSVLGGTWLPFGFSLLTFRVLRW